MIERVLRTSRRSSAGWRIALLRYFNPVGAHPSGDIGEDPQGIPNNLMPFIAQVAVGRRERLRVFGDDYPTADGTAERDYIHVEDLAAGHVAALDRLAATDEPCARSTSAPARARRCWRCCKAFERAVGRELPYEVVGRRAGDLPRLLGRPDPRQRRAGLAATRTIDDMCADTWRWQSQNPNGYEDRHVRVTDA